MIFDRRHIILLSGHLILYGGNTSLRIALFIFLMISVCGLNSQAQSWTLEHVNTRGDLVAVYFTSSSRGWIAGDNGYLASTTDGGKTWTPYPLKTNEDINEIYFRDNDNGYLIAGRKMFITRDAGRSWQETRIYRTAEFGTGTPEFLSIKFSDKKRGYVIGSVLKGKGEVVVESLLMRTDDGGETWQRINVPAKVELFHIDFSGSSRGWIVGDGGTILTSVDSGMTWSRQVSATSVPLFSVHFRDDKEGYVVGKSGMILRTSNGGATWEKVATPVRETFMRVGFTDDKNGWIVGYSGNILRSGDKGRTWTSEDSNTADHLYGLYMDKKFGWSVGAKGVVLSYKK